MYKSKTHMICVLAMGIALYVALSMAIRVPVFENYYICLGYIVMASYAYTFGPVESAIVGSIGCILYCLITSGMRGMPGWTLGNLVIGIGIGLLYKYWKNTKVMLSTVFLCCGIILSVFLGIMMVKSYTEVVLYDQPMIVRMTKNSYAFIADFITLYIGTPIAVLIDKRLHKTELIK